MKSLILVILLTLCSYASATETCLSCMKKDKTATFLVSYSYCNTSDVCLQNRWNYIDRPCVANPNSNRTEYGWILGRWVPMDYCLPMGVECHAFTSTPA